MQTQVNSNKYITSNKINRDDIAKCSSEEGINYGIYTESILFYILLKVISEHARIAITNEIKRARLEIVPK